MASVGVAPSTSKPSSQALSEIGILLPTVHLGSFKGMTVENAQSRTPSSEGQRNSRPLSTQSSNEPRRSPRTTTQNDSSSPIGPASSIALAINVHSQGPTSSPEGDDQPINIGEQGIPSPRPSVSRTLSLSRQQESALQFAPSTSLDPDKGFSENSKAPSPMLGNMSRPEDTSSTPRRSNTVSASADDDDDNTSRNRPSIETRLRIVNGPWRVDPSINTDPYNTPAAIPSKSSSINGRPVTSSTPITTSYPNSPTTLSFNRAQELPPSPGPAQYTSLVNGIQHSPSSRYPVLPRKLASPKLANVARPQFAQKVVPPEEVCIECMMRDRDMADVDVTSPGIWERESDVWYEELCRKEEEEARLGIFPSQFSNKPRAYGDQLTEANLQVWLTMVCESFCRLVMVIIAWISLRPFFRTRRSPPRDGKRSRSSSRLRRIFSQLNLKQGSKVKESRVSVSLGCRTRILTFVGLR